MKSIGILEVSGTVAAVEALDAMLKTADVEVLTWEKKLGGRLVSVIVHGSISSVREAIEQGEKRANQITFAAAKAYINNPSEEVVKLIERSAKKYQLTDEAKQV